MPNRRLLVGLLVASMASPLFAAKDIQIRNCSDKLVSICVYNSDDELEAISASQDLFLEPSNTHTFHCSTDQCKIRGYDGKGYDCTSYSFGLGKRGNGQYSLQIDGLDRELVDGFQCLDEVE
jgi:hypothetical protein